MERNGRRNADSALIAALASGAKMEEAAKLAGIGLTTLYRRLKEEDFRRQVAEARAAVVSATVGQLTETATEAVRTLQELLGASQPPTVRLGAARAILEFGSRLRESEELEARVRRLEETTTMKENTE